MAGSNMTPPTEPSSPTDGGIRKRVCKACDRCRLKKSKCDGSSPCSRCKADNAICFFGERKKSHDKVYPKGYVEMLEAQQAQLVAGIQELYTRAKNGQSWNGAPLKETSSGFPLTHDILERLGALKQDGQTTSDRFEDNLEELQQRMLANGAGFMQREASFDARSDIDRSSSADNLPKVMPAFANPFQGYLPPTPPQQSPQPGSVQALKPEYQGDIQMGDFANWPPEYNMEFPQTFEPMEMTMAEMDLQAQFPQLHGSINPVMTMKDWDQQQQMSRFFNNNLMA